jgi:hypothetical protein
MDAYLKQVDPDYAKASSKDRAAYISHIKGLDVRTQFEKENDPSDADFINKQEAGYQKAYRNEQDKNKIVLSDADVATLGLGGIGIGRTIAKQGLKASIAPITKGIVGAAAGSAAGSYGGRELGKIVGQPEVGAQIGATLGGLAGGFYGGFEKTPALGTPENPGYMSKLPTRLPPSMRGDPFAPKPTVAAPVWEAPSHTDVYGSPEFPGPFSPVPNKVPAQFRGDPFAPPASSGGVARSGPDPFTPYERNVTAGQEPLIVTPSEAASLNRLQSIAEQRARERGMQYAGGVRTAGKNKVVNRLFPPRTDQ